MHTIVKLLVAYGEICEALPMCITFVTWFLLSLFVSLKDFIVIGLNFFVPHH